MRLAGTFNRCVICKEFTGDNTRYCLECWKRKLARCEERLQKLLALNSPKVLLENERRMIREAEDAIKGDPK